MTMIGRQWQTRDIEGELRPNRVRASLLLSGVGLFFWQGVAGSGLKSWRNDWA
jgi:hypothetical protein